MNDELKYTIDNHKNFPSSLLKQVYDADDNVLFGSHYVKGKVAYNYVDGCFAKDGIPFIVGTSVSYDGKGNVDLPKDSIILPFDQLSEMFPNNKFE